jgi:hypothetical protein
MTTYITFQDNETEICTGTTCDPETCTLYHPADDILRPRFVFWVKTRYAETRESFGCMAHFVESITEYDEGEHFAPGDAVVKDLKTNTKLDITEFFAQYAAK